MTRPELYLLHVVRHRLSERIRHLLITVYVLGKYHMSIASGWLSLCELNYVFDTVIWWPLNKKSPIMLKCLSSIYKCYTILYNTQTLLNLTIDGCITDTN